MESSGVLLVLPALNEEEALKKLASEIPPLYDVLVVDSMSSDGTAGVARDAGFACVPARYGRGQGSGVRTGFDYFLEHSYSYMLLMDCDCTDDPKDLQKVLARLKTGGFDLVIGVRDMAKQREYLGVEAILVKSTVSRLIRLLTGLHIRDMLTGVWAFDRRSAERITPRLRETGFEYGFEIVYNAWLLGLGIGEEDVGFRPRVGMSKLTMKERLVQVMYGIKYGLKVLQVKRSRGKKIIASGEA